MKNLVYLSLLVFLTVASCKKESVPTVIYQDTLATNDQTWPTDSSGTEVQKYDQGHFSIRVDSPVIIDYARAPYANINFPYTVQVDGTIILDDPGQWGSTAVMFNYVDHADYSVVEVWANGLYRVWTRANGSITTVVNFTFNSAINTGSGSKNTIKVIQNQSGMELRVNGVSMGTFGINLPSSLLQTGPGVSTAGSPDYTPVTGWFNNFSISKN